MARCDPAGAPLRRLERLGVVARLAPDPPVAHDQQGDGVPDRAVRVGHDAGDREFVVRSAEVDHGPAERRRGGDELVVGTGDRVDPHGKAASLPPGVVRRDGDPVVRSADHLARLRVPPEEVVVEQGALLFDVIGLEGLHPGIDDTAVSHDGLSSRVDGSSGRRIRPRSDGDQRIAAVSVASRGGGAGRGDRSRACAGTASPRVAAGA